MKQFFKQLFCSHYYEDSPSPEFYIKWMETPNPNGFGNMKLFICNECGKTIMKDYNFKDIKRIT